MTQTRRGSLLEAATQAAIGIPIGFGVTLIVGMMELDPFIQAFVITVAMFVVSTVRGYVIRRRFERVVRAPSPSRLPGRGSASTNPWCGDDRVYKAQEDAIHDHFEPLTSTNWEPPKHER